MKKIFIVIFALALGVMLSAQPSFGQFACSTPSSPVGIVPVFGASNPPLCTGGFRINPPVSDTYILDAFGNSVTVTITTVSCGQVFSWSASANVVIDHVFARSGVFVNDYNYTGQNPRPTSDGNLHSVVFLNGYLANLTHIDFCYHVNPAVTVADASTCVGGNATITANVSGGTAPFSYAWTVPGGESNPGNVSSFSATVAGNYAVVVTDDNGYTGSGNGDLTVTPNPTAEAGANQTIITGSSITIGGSPTGSGGTGALSYSWSPTDGLSDASSANPTAEPAATTTYTVTVTNENGCEATDDVTITVQSPEEATEEIIELVENLGIDGGTTNSLTAMLENAIASLQSGNITAASNQLNAFINQVQAQSGKKITVADANMLIAQAQAIIDAINASAPKRAGQFADDLAAIPDGFALEQNYPNPFNPSTMIRFQLPVSSQVVLGIYSTTGQLLRTLVSGQMAAGSHSLVWDAANDNGVRVASGVYLYKLQAGSFTQVRKMSLLR